HRPGWRLRESSQHAWAPLFPGDPGFLSGQPAFPIKVGIGDPIEGAPPTGRWKTRVIGIYADYGNPKAQIAVNFPALTRHFPNIPLTRIGLRVEPKALPALMSGLREKIGLDERNLIDQATLKAESKRIFNRTFAVTAALNAF